MIIVLVSLVRVLPCLFVITIYYHLCLIFYTYVSWSQWLALACIWEIRYASLWLFCICLALFNGKIYCTVNYSFIFILYFKLNQRLIFVEQNNIRSLYVGLCFPHPCAMILLQTKRVAENEYIVCQSTNIAELTNSATPCIERSGVKEILGEITNQLQEKQNRLHKLDMEPRT